MITACLFDVDGVIVDSVDAHYHSMVDMFKKHNFNLYTYELDEELGAISTKEKIKNVEKIFNIKFKNIDEMYIDKFNLLDFNLIKLNNNFPNILNYLEEKNIKVAFVTNARKEYVKKILEMFNIDSSKYIIASNSLNLKQKPEPDLYNWSIKSLDVNSNECIIFEDSEIGIISAEKTRSNVIKINNYLELTEEYIRKILNDNENEHSYPNGREWK